MIDFPEVLIHKIISYILLIKVKRDVTVKIGALGIQTFPKGYYVYIGSGKKNLMERIKRHLGMKKKNFWHIDYLLTKKDVSILDTYISEKSEKEIVNLLEDLDNVEPSIIGFGSSDSKHRTHLFRFFNRDYILNIIKGMES